MSVGVMVTIFPDGGDRYFNTAYCDEVTKRLSVENHG